MNMALMILIALSQVPQDEKALREKEKTLVARIEALPEASQLRKEYQVELEKVRAQLRALKPGAEPKKGIKIEKVEFLESRCAKPKGSVLAEGEALDVAVKVAGVTEKEGLAHCELDVLFKDASGAVRASQKGISGGELRTTLGFPHAWFLISLNKTTGTVGKMKLVIVARDGKSGETDTWESDLTIEEAKLGIYNLRFLTRAKGEDGKPARAEVPGLFFTPGMTEIDVAWRLLGLRAEGPRVHFKLRADVLDAKSGAVLYTTEGKGLENMEYKGRGAEDGIIQMSHTLFLTRSGEFIVRIVVEDKVAEKTATRELRFRVVSPEDLRDF
jgi:hypothetical protein